MCDMVSHTQMSSNVKHHFGFLFRVRFINNTELCYMLDDRSLRFFKFDLNILLLNENSCQEDTQINVAVLVVRCIIQTVCQQTWQRIYRFGSVCW